MDKKEYILLLDEAYRQLPEVLNKYERFTLPKVKGHLVRTRTHITNFEAIAKELERDCEHMSRFFFKEFGVRGNLQNGTLILNSRFQPSDLNNSVKKYFEGFVECSHCKSPDTQIDKGKLKLVCKACGHTQKIQKL